MYLSRVTLDTADPRALRLLSDHYSLHQLVWSAFPDRTDGGPGRVLFRVEPPVTGRCPVVLVQSEREPRWGETERSSVLSAEWKSYTPRPAKGRRLRFRLRANPTARRVFAGPAPEGEPKRSGKRVGVYKEEAQRKWLEAKAEQAGFRLLDYQVFDRGFVVSRKPEREEAIRHLCVDFEGILEVTDPKGFLTALESGIGSAKGFGFGLLSVAPA
jgi:CRISPR system Cascade subunit CasE